MPQITQTGVNATEFYRELINEFHRQDFKHYKSIFKPPAEYIDEIEEPVTLAIVEENLEEGRYENKPWHFIRDVTISLNILIQEYAERSATHKKALELKELFEVKMDKFMMDRGYCCGRWYISKAKEVTCSAGTEENPCKLTDHEVFYRYENFTFCEAHLKEKLDKRMDTVQLNFNT